MSLAKYESKKFSLGHLYADETELFYRATPDGSLCYKRETLEGSKKAMDRITVLCCCNMAGTDKKKMLIIGKSAKPRCFKIIKIINLPVSYLANKNTWMTAETFTSWLKDWDKEFGKQLRKILLTVDNAGPHPKLIDLKNITLEFLPPNTTSLVQPLDMGIIKNLKTHYRGLLVTYILKAIEDNLVTPSTCAIDISSKINILKAIQFVAESWRKVSVTIQHCFAHCGFRPLIDLPIPPIVSIENDVVQCVGNGELFIKIDDGVQCFNENENDDNILDEIAERSLQNEESNDDDDDV
ncbi:tigger transposable element-derived protein 6-like [Acyrthosiphon pisum]|uniref:DDE-1 domain-containing protein n=1 Tax=Acyrthosiphon pisum TaxID=7029 RepID=A0A8R2B7C3_ACYPI|nr:tigger transposable element-derived protein 6-like [Acyrthosiphon pisum]|eukprot:XP_008184737.1 PREDICTED: tigger transposable element-derived protein 6-like [Acyrthosiphon pisum]